MTETIHALVGQYDSGRLIEKGKEIVELGGVAGDVDKVVDEIKKRRPERVVICGEMLPVCVRIAVEKLLDWEEGGQKMIKVLVVDLANSRSYGSVSNEVNNGGFNPTQEELTKRRLAFLSRLSKETREDPRLKIVDKLEREV